MTYSSACLKCGETLYRDDVHCPRCGTRREESVLAAAPVRGATRALAATAAAGDGAIPTCPSCQAPRLQGDVFCTSCGTPFEGTSAPSPGPGAPPPPADPGVGRTSPPSPTPTPPSGSPPDGEVFDGWHEVRLQLEAATQGEFDILRELGRGGMAAVYLAHDVALGRNVAIKVMAPGLLMGPGMVDRFRQEAVTVANLHHPNIVTIHTVRQAGSLHFFVMQVVEGGSLEDVLDRPDRIPVYLIQTILYQLGVGLSYAHRRGVVHRDIKPANVLLDLEGNAILTDFGIAKVTTASHLTQTGATIGTPAYMSPEQCMARELTGASDQYSLGVVAYEMLTGQPPFSGSPFEIMQAHTSKELPSIREQRPDCPPELEAAVFRMLAKNPGDRFPDVAEAIEALGGYLPGPQDPIRSDLVRLVRAEGGQPLPDRAPLKPTPGQAATPVPASRQGTVEKPDRGRRPIPLWAIGAAGLATIGAALFVALRPSAEDAPPAEAPAARLVQSISFANDREEVLVGGTVHIRASLQDSQGRSLEGEAVSWTSDNPSIAAVEGSNEEVVITGVSPGSASILARAGEVEASFQVEVTAPAAGELSVSAPGRELVVGRQMSLSAILTDETGTQVPDADVSWSSSNPRVLEVDAGTGTVTARGLGRAQVTATSGDQTGSVTITVLGRVDAVGITPPAAPPRAGGFLVLKAVVTAQPGGYLGAGGISWSSSNSSVASVASAAADSVVLSLAGEGETVLTARADAVQGTFPLRVLAPPVSATLNLSPATVTLNGTEGGNAPEPQTVRVTVTGDVAPTLGAVQYGPGAEGWLTPTLGASAGGEAVLTLQAGVGGLGEGSYTAAVPIIAGSLSRSVEVRLTLASNPANVPVEATDAAAREITALLAEYSDAINTRNVNQVREIFPTLPQDAVDDLLGLRDTDTYYLQLAPGSLRLGTREGTLEGDVLSGVLGRDNQGQLVRMIYTFGRGQRGWYIVSLRAGG